MLDYVDRAGKDDSVLEGYYLGLKDYAILIRITEDSKARAHSFIAESPIRPAPLCIDRSGSRYRVRSVFSCTLFTPPVLGSSEHSSARHSTEHRAPLVKSTVIPSCPPRQNSEGTFAEYKGTIVNPLGI